MWKDRKYDVFLIVISLQMKHCFIYVDVQISITVSFRVHNFPKNLQRMIEKDKKLQIIHLQFVSLLLFFSLYLHWSQFHVLLFFLFIYFCYFRYQRSYIALPTLFGEYQNHKGHPVVQYPAQSWISLFQFLLIFVRMMEREVFSPAPRTRMCSSLESTQRNVLSSQFSSQAHMKSELKGYLCVVDDSESFEY